MNTSDFELREYQTRDKEGLAGCVKALRQHLIRLNPDRRREIPSEFFETYFAEVETELATGDRKIFVIEVDKKIVGYVSGVIKKLTELEKLQFIDHPSGEIRDLYVDENFRNHGFGTLLLEKIEAFFQAKGCYKTTLTVLEANSNAVQYYEDLGFEVYSLEMIKRN